MKNKPKWKPIKGYVYLATTKPGTIFLTEDGTKGIHIESNNSRSQVIIIDCPHANTEEDKRYYLGKQNWAANTEVRRLSK